jgi:tetratricopeptide (TPR) repeat protein
MGENEEAAERGAQQNAFIGRTRELSELRGALEQSLAGRGSCFLISGEPGIGKTRLADELAADAASRGARVAWGRCWEGGGAPAYWPWVEIVRALVLEPGRARPQQTAVPPEIGQLIPELAAETTQQRSSSDPEQGRFRLFDAVATLVKQVARSAPVVLILDDLHEADRGSLEMLKFIARGLADSRVVIVGTYRDAEVRRSSYLAESISAIVRHGHPMPLAGLAENEVAQMVEHRAERSPSATFASELHRVTAGNPLFVDGVIRVLVAERKLGTAEHLDLSGFELPEGVRGAIRKRLALLSAEARTALTVAAVIGQEFDSVLHERVHEESTGQLAELMREAAEVGIVAAASPESYRFTHPLIREALYKDSTEAERMRLHCATGEAVEQIHAANLTPHLSALAHHFNAAGVVEKALDYSIRAGNAAFSVFAYQEAASHFQAALGMMEDTAAVAEQKAGLLERLAAVTFSTNEVASFTYLEQALILYKGLNRTERLAHIHIVLGVRCATPTAMLDIARAHEHFQKAEAALGDDQCEPIRARLHYGISLAAGRTLQTEIGLAASERAMQIADRLEDRVLWALAAARRAECLICTGRLMEGFALVNRAWRAADDLNDHGTTFGPTTVGGGASYNLDDPHECLAWFDRELAKPRTARATYQRRWYLACSAEAHVKMGEFSDARHILSQIDSPYGLSQRDSPYVRAFIALAEGDWQAAEGICAAFHDWHLKRGCRPLSFVRFFGWVLRLQRKYSAAEALLLSALAICRGDSVRYVEMLNRPELALLYADMNRYAEAIPHLERCREIVAAGENWRGHAGHLARAEAVVAASDGNHQEAEKQFGMAIEVYRQYALPWEEAEALLYWGRALHAIDDARANEKFGAAIELYKRSGGSQCWIDRVEAARIELPAAPRSKQLPSDDECLFHREGEYWTVVWHGKTSRLKDAKGLRYIAYLLAHPGDQIHVHDLITVVEGGAVDTQSHATAHSDGLEIVRDVGARDSALDSRARSEYGARLRELRTELDEAQRFNDTGRSERLLAEIELVSDELSVGLRRRSSSDNAERARGMVSKRIRATLDKIHDQDPSLSRHFTTSIKTGYFCAYLPDPDHKFVWQM